MMNVARSRTEIWYPICQRHSQERGDAREHGHLLACEASGSSPPMTVNNPVIDPLAVTE
jgi:hypothetical protein